MRRAPRRLNHLTVAKLIRALQLVPCSVYDAAEVTGLAVCTCREFLLALKAEKAVRVVDWDTDSIGRAVTAVYALGEGQDKKKPKPRNANAALWKRQQRARAKKAAQQQAVILGAVHAGHPHACPAQGGA